uniref:RING-type domain-containing protein n=1 Tax=Onchocerca volvulus TaxID=6282 RepID=A0A8R1XSB6_ONCVO
MFGVEALKDSREFSEARFTDVTAVQGAIDEKETFLANLGPFADLLDQYASVCNEVISLFAHVILRLLETINNIGSPVEIFTSSCSFLLILLYSIFHILVCEVTCLIIWPFRTLLNLLISHPFVLTLISLFLILSCTTFIVIIKGISVVHIGNTSMQFIILNCRRFTHIIFLYFHPLIVAVLHFLLLPMIFSWDMCTNFIGMILVSKSKRLRRHSSICGTDDVSRITCCICFIHEKSILLQPCNHICVCAHCVEELLETYEEPLCPLCRSVITSYVDVYI